MATRANEPAGEECGSQMMQGSTQVQAQHTHANHQPTSDPQMLSTTRYVCIHPPFALHGLSFNIVPGFQHFVFDKLTKYSPCQEPFALSAWSAARFRGIGDSCPLQCTIDWVGGGWVGEWYHFQTRILPKFAQNDPENNASLLSILHLTPMLWNQLCGHRARCCRQITCQKEPP